MLVVATDESTTYSLYNNKNLIKTLNKSECSRGITTIDNAFICEDSNSKMSFYDLKGNKYAKDIVVFKNASNYVTLAGKVDYTTNKYNFYNNNKLVKTLTLRKINNVSTPINTIIVEEKIIMISLNCVEMHFQRMNIVI
jgi:hypothetical protein